MASTFKTWLLVTLGVPSLILALLAAAAYIFANSDWGRDWLRQQLEAEIRQSTGMRMEVDRLDGNLLWRIEAHGLRLMHGQQEVLTVRRLEVTYNLLAIIGGALRIGDCKADGLRLALARLPDMGDDQGGGPAVTIRRLALSDVQVDPGGLLGPLKQLAGVSIKGHLDWESGGGNFIGKVAAQRIDLAGLSQPISLDGLVRWQGDLLHLVRLDLSLGPNRAALAGKLHLGRRLRLDLQLAAENIDAIALPFAWPGPRPPTRAFAAKAKVSGRLDDLKVSAVVHSGAGRLRLSGGLDLPAMAWRSTLGIRQVDLGQWGLAPTPVSLTGEVKASGVGLPLSAGSRATLGLDLPQMRAAGQDFSQVRAEVELRGNNISLKSLTAQGLGGELQAQGQVTLAADPALGLRLGFKGLKPPAAWTAPLAGGEFSGSLEANGTVSRLTCQVRLGPSVISKGLALDSLAAQIMLADGQPVLQDLSVISDFLTFSAKGRADLKAADISATLEVRDLARLDQALAALGLETTTALKGKAQASFSLKGPWSGPALELRGSLSDLAMAETSVKQVEITAKLSRLGPRPLGRVRILARDLLAAAETWPEVDLEAEAVAELLSCRLAAQGLERQLSVDLRLNQWWQWPLQGRIMNLIYHQNARGQWRQQGAAKISLRPGAMRLDGLALAQGEQEVSVTGEFLRQGVVSGQVQVRRFKVAPYLPPDTGLPPTALLDGQAQLGGTLAAPRLQVSGELSGLKVRGLPDSRARLEGGYADGWLTLQGDILTGGITTLALKGRMGLNLKLMPPWLPDGFGKLDFTLTSRQMPLTLFQPVASGLQELKGNLNVDLAVQGTLERPRIVGDIKLADGSFILAATGQHFSGITAHLQADGREVVVRQLSTDKAGQLWMQGKAVLPGDDAGKLSLRCRTQGLQVSFGAFGGGTADADIALAGTFAQPRLTGVITPRQITLRLGLGAPEAMSDVVILKPGQKPPSVKRKPAVVKTPAVLAPLTMVAVVSVDRTLRVKVNQGWVEVNGRIVIRKEPGGPLTYHRGLKILRGRILYEARAFKITGGSVDFGGKKVIDPDLKDVRAELSLGKTQVQLVAQGPASDLQLQFTSQPPMSQADILSTIVFGQPAASLSQDQYDKLSAQALALLGMKGRQELERLVGRKLAPDVVTVGRGYDVGSFLEAGKYLSDDLYLRYRRSAQADGGQNVGLEYRINRFFSIESQVGTTRDSGVDFTITFDF